MRIAVCTLMAGLAAASMAPAADAPPADEGARVYGTICQGCHMPAGEGAVGAGAYPKLAGNPRLVAWQYVALTVLQGRKGMPGFASQPDADPAAARMLGALTDEQVAAVVNYVRTHFGNDYRDKATVQDVKALPHPGGNAAGHAG